MKKETKCNECNGIIEEYKICDTCGYKLKPYSICEVGSKIFDLKGNPIELNIEGQSYDFCSLQCIKQFINEEITKGEKK